MPLNIHYFQRRQQDLRNAATVWFRLIIFICILISSTQFWLISIYDNGINECYWSNVPYLHFGGEKINTVFWVHDCIGPTFTRCLDFATPC